MIKKVSAITAGFRPVFRVGAFCRRGMCYGQNNDASLSGSVTDTTNAAIPGREFNVDK